uniref:Probable rhamnogalacturonate lyase B n=1 Tax=Elaeis guineensis var. tenera TaxID=51953 RepID=A0A6I9QDX9_ELAGV|nr:probable rhamnogalacturonate lyase B [Elaeis guineensis]
MSATGVRVSVQDQYVIIDNGILQLTLSNPDGIVTGVRYNGLDNLMEVLNKEDNRGYWDLAWNAPRASGAFDVIKGTDFRIILQSEEQVEVSFTRTWAPSLKGKLVPLKIDKRFVVLRGSSGFYTYATFEHLQGWPDFDIDEIRVTFKLRKDKIDAHHTRKNIDLGDLVYEPPRDGVTLWEIGVPDRSAAEFYIPDPDPRYVNRLYVNLPTDRFRQYGLWDRYAELHPDGDLVYTIGKSDYKKDWFFAQVTRKTKQNSYQPTTWQIKFHLDSVNQSGNYKLRVALASATLSELQVRFNDLKANPAHFTTRLIGRDNSIVRHGIHGLYWLYNVDIQSAWLVQGDNTIFLTQPRNQSAFQEIMYDYIRMEGPSNS